MGCWHSAACGPTDWTLHSHILADNAVITEYKYTLGFPDCRLYTYHNIRCTQNLAYKLHCWRSTGFPAVKWHILVGLLQMFACWSIVQLESVSVEVESIACIDSNPLSWLCWPKIVADQSLLVTRSILRSNSDDVANEDIYWIFIRVVLHVPEGRSPSSNLLGHIEFSNIHFSYPSRPEVAIFSGLDLVVPSGSVTAVVGSSGSGKSTLTALLMRFYDPTSGTLNIDGTNVRDFSPHWLRTHMSVVHQVQVSFI